MQSVSMIHRVIHFYYTRRAGGAVFLQ
jgi:hypothetical protein